MNKIREIFIISAFRRLCYSHIRPVSSLPEVSKSNQQNDLSQPIKKPSVLDQYNEEDVSHVAPYLKPTFNFAAYVNKSETLQELLKLGVNLHKLEKKPNVPEFIMGLNFEPQVKEHVIFLHQLGLSIEEVGFLITKNPFIFKETLENFSVRITYLISKKFTQEMIVRIVARNPYWLSYSTKDIDKKLGFIQKLFALTGNEVRAVATKQPKLITYNQSDIKRNIFALKEEMGFEAEEYKHMFLDKPRIFMNDHKKILQTFEYLHNTMKIPQEMIVQIPEILTCRVFRLRQRYEYLKQLKKVQFNPKEPGYISPLLIVAGTDEEFVSNVAKTSIPSFNTFLKTL